MSDTSKTKRIIDANQCIHESKYLPKIYVRSSSPAEVSCAFHPSMDDKVINIPVIYCDTARARWRGLAWHSTF
uniref:Uncharacterized protein n=1 Tax=Octopus bimaculoides TaxID=37653 RepID=A0A0L8I4E5_OCTBM